MMQGVEVGGKGVLLEVATFREKARIVPFVDKVFPFDQQRSTWISREPKVYGESGN
jgi:hypothetical protein